jgi:hypothetical protein
LKEELTCGYLGKEGLRRGSPIESQRLEGPTGAGEGDGRSRRHVGRKRKHHGEEGTLGRAL